LIKTERPNEETPCGGLGGRDADGTQCGAVIGGLLPPSLLASLRVPSLLPPAATSASASASVRLLRHSARRDLLALFNPEAGDFSGCSPVLGM